MVVTGRHHAVEWYPVWPPEVYCAIRATYHHAGRVELQREVVGLVSPLQHLLLGQQPGLGK